MKPSDLLSKKKRRVHNPRPVESQVAISQQHAKVKLEATGRQ
jgi:hypothetical protein